VFGSDCEFEDGHKAVDPRNVLLQLSYAGSAKRLTTAFNVEGGPIVRCGCFVGSLEEFRAKVRETHADSKHALVYLGWANLVAVQFDRLDLIDYTEAEHA
jgi:hypothetical protein